MAKTKREKQKRIRLIYFGKNYHPEFDGCLMEEGGGAWMPFIISKNPSEGNFSRLLKELKEKYDWIKIPAPSSTMKKIVLGKGFRLKADMFLVPLNRTGEAALWERYI